jgi:hypothetical protein
MVATRNRWSVKCLPNGAKGQVGAIDLNAR